MIQKELTYEEIGRLKKEQDKLIAEGKIERPQIIRGFSPEDRRDFENGIKLEDYLKQKNFLYDANCPVSQSQPNYG